MFFKKDINKTITKLEIKLAGLVEKERCQNHIMEINGKARMHMIEEWIDLRTEIAEVKKTLDILKDKRLWNNLTSNKN